MACGKTTIGSEIASQLAIPFIDLDQYIEQENKTTVANLIRNKGEIYFRQLEHQALKKILATKNEFILSLGGGTPCYGNNHLLYQAKDILSVYLQVSPSILAKRILEDTHNQRPLVQHLQQPDELTEYIAKHLFDRAPFYTQATHTIYTNNKDLATICTDIYDLIQ